MYISCHHNLWWHCCKPFLLCMLWSMPNCVILLWVVWNKKQEQARVWSVWAGEQIYCFCEGFFHSAFGLVKYPYTNTIHVISLDWSNTHLFLLYYCILVFVCIYNILQLYKNYQASVKGYFTLSPNVYTISIYI